MSQSETLYTLKRIAYKSVAFVIFFSSLQALSAIPYRNAFEQTDLIHSDTKELNLNLLAKIQVIVNQNQLDMTRYIPYASLPQFSSSETVSNRIFRQTLKSFLDDNRVSNTPIVQGAISAQNILNTHAGTAQHQFTFRLNAIETLAEIKYKGLFEAKFSYELSGGHAKFEVSKQDGGRTYAYTHNQTTEGFADNFGVRWSF